MISEAERARLYTEAQAIEPWPIELLVIFAMLQPMVELLSAKGAVPENV